jgi:hypothetical protein
MVAVNHPNPWVLLCKLEKELSRAELEALWIQVNEFSIKWVGTGGNFPSTKFVKVNPILIVTNGILIF